MNESRLMQIVLSPLTSEKAAMAEELSNQVVFKVMRDANKKEIKQAVEMLFKVDVLAVRTSIRKPKKKVFRGRLGVRSAEKKAYVTLKDGQSIDYLKSSSE